MLVSGQVRHLIDDDGTITAHFRCYICDYNLHGLSLDGVCPECGTLIARTIEKKRPPPRWTRPIDLTVIGWITAVLGLGVWPLLRMLSPMRPTPILQIVSFIAGFLVAPILQAAASFIAIRALTRPSVHLDRYSPCQVRRAARVALVVSGAYFLALLLLVALVTT
jgi:hypothetical protein